MKYLVLVGLFIMTLGGLLPFRVIVGGNQYTALWFLPMLGVFLMVFLKKESLNNSRAIGGVFGLLTGVLTTILLIETLDMPLAAGISVGKSIPIFLFGSAISCLGGFAKPGKATSLSHNIGLILIISGFVIIFIIGSFASFFYSQILSWNLETYELLPLSATLSLIAIFIGVVIVVREFIKVILSDERQNLKK